MKDLVLFFLNNFIDSNIHCIDTWYGSDEHDNFDFSVIEKNFDYNTSTFQSNNRLKKFKMSKKNFLNIKKILNNNNLFYKQNNVYVNKTSENYSKNFELQWKEFPLTQFDSSTGFPLTRNRFSESSNWHFNEIKDKLIIELGSGA